MVNQHSNHMLKHPKPPVSVRTVNINISLDLHKSETAAQGHHVLTCQSHRQGHAAHN